MIWVAFRAPSARVVAYVTQTAPPGRTPPTTAIKPTGEATHATWPRTARPHSLRGPARVRAKLTGPTLLISILAQPSHPNPRHLEPAPPRRHHATPYAASRRARVVPSTVAREWPAAGGGPTLHPRGKTNKVEVACQIALALMGQISGTPRVVIGRKSARLAIPNQRPPLTMSFHIAPLGLPLSRIRRCRQPIRSLPQFTVRPQLITPAIQIGTSVLVALARARRCQPRTRYHARRVPPAYMQRSGPSEPPHATMEINVGHKKGGKKGGKKGNNKNGGKGAAEPETHRCLHCRPRAPR